MNTTLSFFFIIFLIVYFFYCLLRPVDDSEEYDTVSFSWNGKTHEIVYKITQGEFLEESGRSIIYYLKDALYDEFYTIVYFKLCKEGFLKFDYCTHFGISRAKEGSFLKTLIDLEPDKRNDSIRELIIEIEKTRVCPYKIN